MKKYFKLFLLLSLATLFQSCFFSSYDDSGYGVFFLILPFLFFVGLIITGITFLFVKEKSSRIWAALAIFSPFIAIYIISEIHYFPGYIEAQKREAALAKRKKESMVKELNIYCHQTFANLTDNEIILFPKENKDYKNFVVLKKNPEDDIWKEEYRFPLNTDLLKKGWQLNDTPSPTGNNKYLVTSFNDGSLKVNKKYYYALFRKNEKWELADVIENPYNNYDTAFALSGDFLAVANSIYEEESVVSIYKLSADCFDLIQTIDIADSSHKNWTYSCKVNFYKNELIISDCNFTNNNAAIWSEDFDGCGKLSFYTFKDGSFREKQSITYKDVSFDNKKKYVGLGHKIEAIADDCLVVKDTSKNQIIIKKINDEWKCVDESSLDPESLIQNSDYEIYKESGSDYIFDNQHYRISFTTYIRNNKNKSVQEIVMNPSDNTFYTRPIKLGKTNNEPLENAWFVEDD